MGSWEQRQCVGICYIAQTTMIETMCYFPQTATGFNVRGSIHQHMDLVVTNISLPVISLEPTCHRCVFSIQVIHVNVQCT